MNRHQVIGFSFNLALFDVNSLKKTISVFVMICSVKQTSHYYYHPYTRVGFRAACLINLAVTILLEMKTLLIDTI